MEENRYNAKLLEEIEHIKLGLKWYMSENARLENELKLFQNAYENRVNEYLKDKE